MRRELLLLVLFNALPARCVRQPIKGLSVSGNTSFQSFVVAALILGFDSRRVLLNFRQLPIEGLTLQEVLERCRFGSEVLAYIRLIAEERPGCPECFPRSLKVVQPRFRQKLCELGGTFDGVFNGAMRRIKSCDCIVLRTPKDGFHLANGAFENSAPRKAVRVELAVGGSYGVLVTCYFLAQLRDDGGDIGNLASHFAAKRIPEGFSSSNKSFSLDPFLRAERGLSEEVVVRERVASFDSCRGIDCLTLAGCLDFSGAQQREDEQANSFEIPAERFLRELVGEEPPAGSVPVVSTFLDPGEHLCQGAAFYPKDGLTPFVAQEPEASENRRQALKVLGGE